ncbi:hypothetical protein [Bradyrhizobium cenepequi]|uniref:hypothetical protein n=1 Tax=Bradyrhizobium cenepequi TaxID=2821403 RepID=UPI001CE3983C|nr:hypothetical protein [Bradyrhizobium cenepequi]MCA6111725.1 hypothetical protein [Bradyrhizobium cenepequi]
MFGLSGPHLWRRLWCSGAAFAVLIATARICFELVLTRNLAAVLEAMLPEGYRASPQLHLPIL